MNFIVIIALIVGFAVCILPLVMAWSFHFGGQKKTETRRAPLHSIKPVMKHAR